MNRSELYERLIDKISSELPVHEVLDKNIDEKIRATLSAGSFYGGLNPRIVIRAEHKYVQDSSKLEAILCHEYGHFILDTQVLSRPSKLLRYANSKLNSRNLFDNVFTFSYFTRILIIIEELVAWLIGWRLLLKKQELTLPHLWFGLRCWFTYFIYLKLRFDKPEPQNQGIT